MSDQYPLALPVGSVLAGQYVIEKVLGEGGFGITYCAKDHKSGGRVAIKEFFPDTMATRTQNTVVPHSGENAEYFAYGKECFLQEAQTLAQFIGNESIVRIYSYFEENGTAYFVMDYVEGQSFDAYIKNRGGKLSYDETLKILGPVMDALSLVHSRGIIHRDVTPDNIFITNSGAVKLLDFGAARYSLGDKSQSLDIVLKHGFAPKEQYVRRGKQGPFTDVYALGATFYFALTGKRPPDSIERMDNDTLVPPSSTGVSIPQSAETALLKALSVQPADRFQNMQAFRSAMGGLAQGGAQPVVQRVFTAPTPSPAPTPTPAPMPARPQPAPAYNNNAQPARPYQNSQPVQAQNYNYTRMAQPVAGSVQTNGFSAIVSKYYSITRIVTAVLFVVLALYMVKNDLSQLETYVTTSKIYIVCSVLSKAVLAYAVFANDLRFIRVGLGLKVIALLSWFIETLGYEEGSLFFIGITLSGTVLAVLLLLYTLGKNIAIPVFYVVLVASFVFIIAGQFIPIFYLAAISSFLLIIIIVYRQGGENHGFN